VPFDREGTLRKAEKLVRQGRPELAIAEYRSVIEDQPSDWNTANTLGDLYFRVGQVDKAVAEFDRIAEHLAIEGFTLKAVALYRKILKIKPDDERAMWHLGALSAGQGLMVDARAHYLALARRRQARGDRQGEAEVLVRLGDLEGADLESRLTGARARVELGDARTAVERLKTVAAELQDKGKTSDSLRLLTEAAQIDPEDIELRRLLVHAYVARGDFEAASQFATSAGDLKGVAEELLRQGRTDEGINVLRSAADADPDDHGVRAVLARLLLKHGDVAGARSLLTSEVAASDPALLWSLAEMEFRDGRIPEGTAVLQQILDEDPSLREQVVLLGCSLADDDPEAGYECVDVAVRAAVAVDEWVSAAAAMNELVRRLPNHIPALMRVVEVSVDGGLEATMHAAQAQLADAYLAVGAGAEARMIAEDLVAREPWEPANIERFRRALTLLGETDIDTIIADRLSGQKPFTSTDFLWPADPGANELTPTPVASQSHAELEHAPRIVVQEPPAATLDPPIDIVPLTRRVEPVAKPESHEVDLSEVLRDLRKGSAESDRSAGSAGSIESVLKDLREEVLHDTSPEMAEQHFKLAGDYIQMGMREEALNALEVAARSPRHRFRAAAMLAKAYLDQGDRHHAIEWYERAVEAPAPSPEAHYAQMYQLATVLEAHGESARALAVLLELQSEAGDYRDLSRRLEQLKVQMGN
jgi:tetratricopeptide (TPR) repeat protein